MKKVILSVISDLVSDQRMHKIANSLNDFGFEVLLLGRKNSKSLAISPRKYKTFRINTFFRRGAISYAEFNIRLFFFLLFSKVDILVANDLDTLLPNYLLSKIRKKKLVYDSHEYFTELPELQGRNFARKTWLCIEKWILPNVKHSYTVCDSIATEYKKLYNIQMQVVRNIPSLQKNNIFEINIQKNKYIIIYQGALNIGRGIEYVIKSMNYLEETIFWIVGTGEIEAELKKLVRNEKLENKVIFTGKIPFENLASYTACAHLGICLQEDKGLSYRYVLPNRLFDYIHAEIPVVCSSLPEITKIVEEYNIGKQITNYEPIALSEVLREMLENEKLRKLWQHNCTLAQKKLCWQNEEKVLQEIYKNL